MVAHAALVSLRRVLDTILHPAARGCRISTSHNRAKLKTLHKKVSFLLDFLENSSSDYYVRKQHSGLESLETKIRDAAYKAEDVIESDISNQLLAETETVMHTALLKGICFATRQLIYCNYHLENQDLRKAIDDISLIIEEAIKAKDAYCGSLQSADSSDDGLSRPDFGGIGKSVAVGLDSDLNEINDRLIGHSSELEVVSIVGMGGSGKTTLARQVHDDPHIVYHFDICAWVTVSQEYSLRRIMLDLLDSAKIRAEEILQKHRDDVLAQKLGEHFYKNMMSRRYLIVMDDVWDTEIWDYVRRFLPENHNGSRILLTSRLSEVASYATSGSPPLQMRFLNDGDSWHLLCEKVFGGEGCPPELEAIGRRIARNCRGLPLAIVVVGGLLYNEHRTVKDWTNVSRNLDSILSKDDEQCSEILGLSYKQLPHRLKPCFLYMGAFPEDEEIPVTKLFNLWAAEGFLEASNGKSLEEVAEEYLKDLVQRSLILVGKWSCNGINIKTCKIHDLLRDVCLLNSHKENFLDFGNRHGHGHGHERRRRLSTHVHAFVKANYVNWSSCYSMARSFICFGTNVYGPQQFYLGFRLLRVLDVVAANTSYEFRDEIVKLVHLRYLGLTCDWPLPPSISRLSHLQTIVFHYGGGLDRGLQIPVVIWSMPNLRHLYFTGGLLPDPPRFQLLPNYSTVLENLQTLVGISDFRCTKEILRSIPNLKKLCISYDDYSPLDWSEYDLESLVNLHQLETLKITVEYHRPTSFLVHPPKLAFPEKLKKLSLSGCRIPWESMRIVGALPSLQVLKLRNFACKGQMWETAEGEFCELLFLLLEDTYLVQWRSNETHFPRLQRLILRRCHELKEIPYSMGEIATLERMELADCHPYAMVSAKQIQLEQQSMGNEDLKVHIEGDLTKSGRPIRWRRKVGRSEFEGFEDREISKNFN